MNLKQKIKLGHPLFSTMVTINAPEVTEILSNCGFDWLFVDGEHGAIDGNDIQTILLAAGDRIDCLIRVPAIDETRIKKALDLGAAGIIVPQVNSAEQAARVVDYCRYPPEGSRGTGLARAHGYGSKFEEYTSTANEKTLVVVQAEHREDCRKHRVHCIGSGNRRRFHRSIRSFGQLWKIRASGRSGNSSGDRPDRIGLQRCKYAIGNFRGNS